MIIRDAFYGVRRFSKFKERLGITQAVLSSRLANLVEYGILERGLDNATNATPIYSLTAKGRALFPVVVGLVQWGDEWIHGESGPPIILAERTSGAPIDKLQVTLNHEPLSISEVTFLDGPGASEATQAAVLRAKSGERI